MATQLQTRVQYGIIGPSDVAQLYAEQRTGVYFDWHNVFLSYDSAIDSTHHLELQPGGSLASDFPAGGTARICVTWMPTKTSGAVLLSDVAAGVYDAHHTSILNALKTLASSGTEVVIRWAHEMNLSSSSYSTSCPTSNTSRGYASNGTPADYVAAWRHVHDMATSLGVNARWYWCPGDTDSTTQPNGISNLATDYYPGDTYVDIMGHDTYDGYAARQAFTPTHTVGYNRFSTIKPSADYWIGETGTSTGNTVTPQPAWLGQMFTDTSFEGDSTHSPLKVINYFDAVGGRDWRVTDYPSSRGNPPAATINAWVALLQAAPNIAKKGTPLPTAYDPDGLPLSSTGVRQIPGDLGWIRKQIFNLISQVNTFSNSYVTSATVGAVSGIAGLDSGKNVQTYSSFNVTYTGEGLLTQGGITAFKFTKDRRVGIGATADLGNGAYTLSIPDGTPPTAAPSTGVILSVSSGRILAKFADGTTRYLARNTGAVTLAAGGSAGGSAPTPTLTAGGDSLAGVVSFGTGTSPGAGAQVTFTFPALPAAPRHISLTARNTATATLGVPFLASGSVSNTGFSVSFPTAPAASQAVGTYIFSYSIIE